MLDTVGKHLRQLATTCTCTLREQAFLGGWGGLPLAARTLDMWKYRFLGCQLELIMFSIIS